ncbi:MAG TPA: hypothetical protein VLQ48_11105 [Chloroflexia bacterium]|nr:hypothetical protein [Chloroflexia bacterium]
MPDGQTDNEYAPYRVIDVLNYGGFFGGETVTLDARPFSAPDRIVSYIIPEHLFDNLTQRHLIQAGVALGLVVDGGEVRAARVLGAPTREQLKELVKPPSHEEGSTGSPRALSYRCAHCDLWINGMPDRRDDGYYYCRLCGTKLG